MTLLIRQRYGHLLCTDYQFWSLNIAVEDRMGAIDGTRDGRIGGIRRKGEEVKNSMGVSLWEWKERHT